VIEEQRHATPGVEEHFEVRADDGGVTPPLLLHAPDIFDRHDGRRDGCGYRTASIALREHGDGTAVMGFDTHRLWLIQGENGTRA
jgi:hypothetical protein